MAAFIPTSAPLAHQTTLLPRPIAFFLCFALVMHLLAFGERDFDLRAAASVEIEPQRHDSHALPLHALCELGNFARLQQEFARPFRLVIEAIAREIFRNVGVVEPHLAASVDAGITLGDCRFAGAQRLHLRAGERDARLEFLADLVIVASAAVVGDDLEIGFGFRRHGYVLRIPACTMASRIATRVGSVSGTIGSRTFSLIRPRTESAYLGPAGLGSKNRAACNGVNRS